MPVPVGQHHVQQDKIGRARPEALEPRCCGVGDEHIESLLPQGRGKRFGDGLLVLDEQNGPPIHLASNIRKPVLEGFGEARLPAF